MRSLLALALITGLLGCDKPATSAVTFTRGGGFAAHPLTLAIDAAGHVTSSGRTFTLSPRQRSRLAHALDAARGVTLPSSEGGCADCFVYTITADGLSVTYADASPVPDEIGDLTGLLLDLSR